MYLGRQQVSWQVFLYILALLSRMFLPLSKESSVVMSLHDGTSTYTDSICVEKREKFLMKDSNPKIRKPAINLSFNLEEELRW